MVGAETRQKWQQYLTYFEQLGVEQLQLRSKELSSRCLEALGLWHPSKQKVAADYAPQFDPAPMVFTSKDWLLLEKGLAQRAELYNLIFRDLYGRQELIKSGVIPAEFVFAHPGWQSFCFPYASRGFKNIPILSADVVISPTGEFRVLEQHVNGIKGLGTALLGRELLSGVFPSLYLESHIHSHDYFLRKLRQIHPAITDYGSDSVSAVLIDSSHDPHSYDEIAFAGILGMPVAESNALYVEYDRLYWQQVGNDKQDVKVLFRTLPDAACDSLYMGNGHRGIPALLRAAQKGNSLVVNPLGSSVLENPALCCFLEQACRFLLEEELMLASVSSWWCGHSPSLRYVLSHLDEMVIKPLHSGNQMEACYIGSLMSNDEKRNLQKMILNRPTWWMAQELFPSQQVAFYREYDFVQQPVKLKLFLTGVSQEYHLLPGGNAIAQLPTSTANRINTSLRDIWVLSSEPPLNSQEGMA
jgi:uncharacterized circularly permuted ATP-grasp superfamily protein